MTLLIIFTNNTSNQQTEVCDDKGVNKNIMNKNVKKKLVNVLIITYKIINKHVFFLFFF